MFGYNFIGNWLGEQKFLDSFSHFQDANAFLVKVQTTAKRVTPENIKVRSSFLNK